MFKLTLTLGNNETTEISRNDPLEFLKESHKVAEALPKGIITAINIVQSREQDVNLKHFEDTIQTFQFTGMAVIEQFLKVVDQSPDYAKLRDCPAFQMYRSGVNGAGGLALHTSFKSMRDLTLLFAAKQQLITMEQALHFSGFPIRSDIQF